MARPSLGMLTCLVTALLAQSALAAGRAQTRFTVYKKWPFDPAEAKRRQEETAQALGVKVEQDFELAKGVTIRMVLIPAGEFLMGSSASAAEVARLAGLEPERGKESHEGEHPQHRVTISRPFWMGKYEVTQAQWAALMGYNLSRHPGARNPAGMVSWNNVQAFLKKVNAGAGDTGFGLPTEAQWEYACRAGTATAFCFGPTISTDQANYWGKWTYAGGRAGESRRRPLPVGSFPANAWGLHDMHGNAEEWCQDWYGEGYYKESPASDPPGPATGRHRMLRGGGYGTHPRACRSAYRNWTGPMIRFSYIGFRLCRPVKTR